MANENNVLKIENDVVVECLDKKVTNVVIPEGVKEIGYLAFFKCELLESVVIPESVTAIEPKAFDGCTNLWIIKFGGTVAQWEAVKKVSRWNKNVPAHRVQCSDGEWETPAVLVKDGVVVEYLKNSDTWNMFPEGVTAIGEKAFENFVFGFEEVIIPEGVTTIGACAFKNCSSLVNVQLPASLKTIHRNAFYGCTSLEEEFVRYCGTIEQWEAVQGKVNIFRGNPLKHIRCSDGEWQRPDVLVEKITLDVKDAAEQIKQQESQDEKIRICLKGQLNQRVLAGIINAIGDTYSSFDFVVLDLSATTGLTSLKWDYEEEETKLPFCNSVKELVLPADIAEINTPYVFDGFSYLEAYSVALENKYFAALDGVLYTKDMTTLFSWPQSKFVRKDFIVPKGVKTIKESAFENCNGYFDNIVFPKTLRKIGYSAFSYSQIRELIIPDGVTEIGYSAFRYSHFARITFPKSLRRIDFEDFTKISFMPDISFTGTKAELQSSIPYNHCFDDYEPDLLEKTLVHCSDGDVSLKELQKQEDEEN